MPRVLLRSVVLALLALGPGCPAATDDDDASDDATDDDTGDDDSEEIAPPCAGESWGLIDPAGVEAAIHVRASGSDDGDGSLEAPLLTLGAAVELARQRDAADRRIAVGPGTFPANLDLEAEDLDGKGDDGLVIEGCSIDETIVEAADGARPVLRATEAADLRLEGMTLQGGRRTLWFWGGATASIETVLVTGGSRQGIIIEGGDTLLPDEPTTTVELTEVEVRDVVTESGGDGDVGYGIYVASAVLEMTGGGVKDCGVVGIYGHQAEMTLTGVAVTGTAADGDGYLGRGIHLQELSEAVLTDCTLEGNADAGLFSLRSLWVELDGLTVDATTAAELPDDPGQSGDGIVLTVGDQALDPALLVCTLADNEVTASARSGILIEGVSADLQGNVAGADNGLSVGGTAILVQGDSIVTGTDAWAAPPSELAVYRGALTTDDLSQ